MDHALIGMAAGAVAFAANIPYIYSIFKGKTKPNRATWWIWFVLGSIIAMGYYSVGARDTMWVPITAAIGPFIIALLSLKYGVGGWTRFDRGCIVGAALGLVLWALFNSPLVALLLLIFVDALGYLPTMRKILKEPDSEDRLAWSMFYLSAIINLFAVGTWTFEIAVYPIYIFLFNSVVMGLLFLYRPSMKAKT